MDVRGVWRLVAQRSFDAASGEPHHYEPYGPEGMGIVHITDHRVIAVLSDGRAELPDGHSRTFSSYGGHYTFDGSTLVTTVDVSSDWSRLNGQQVRAARMVGDRLVLSPPPREIDGKHLRMEFEWARLAPGSKPRASIHGAWKLVEQRAVDESGEPVGQNPFGEHATGLILSNGDRGMVVVVDNKPGHHDEERKRPYAAYAARVRHETNRLLNHADAASHEVLLGEQHREISFDGKHMVLKAPPTPIGDGRVAHGILVWEPLE
ncbi:hypothetical protein DFJ74DRAFT_691654 [Hyaloraphidium curvatum]|nr:hypothetical protein DFJ74DRAFT_691654 [Hyaloraphidium curvatum]